MCNKILYLYKKLAEMRFQSMNNQVLSISTFIQELYRQCFADFIKCNVKQQK